MQPNMNPADPIFDSFINFNELENVIEGGSDEILTDSQILAQKK